MPSIFFPVRPTDRTRQGGVVLIMVIACIALLAFLVTGFIARMRQDAMVSEDTLYLARNRILLQAAMHYIQETSRLGYASIGADGKVTSVEAYGWIDSRVIVPPYPSSVTTAGESLENMESRRIGPRDANGNKLGWNPQMGTYATFGISNIVINPLDPNEKFQSPVKVIFDPPGSATACAVMEFDSSSSTMGKVVGIRVFSGGNGFTSATMPTVDIKAGPTQQSIKNKIRPEIRPPYTSFICPPSQRSVWPCPGSVMRAPFYRMKCPPFAVAMTVTPNPIPTDKVQATFGIPFLNNADPRPYFSDYRDLNKYDQVSYNYDGDSVSQPSKTLGKVWASGDTTAVDDSLNLGWFRIYREDGTEPDRQAQGGDKVFGMTGGTFIITVGSGGTLGFRDWDEVVALGQTAIYGGNQSVFNELVARERRQWYRVEWTSAVGGGEDHIYAFALGKGTSKPQATWFEQLPINGSRFMETDPTSATMSSYDQSSASLPRNYIGTIRYVQRLPGPPTDRPINATLQRNTCLTSW